MQKHPEAVPGPGARRIVIRENVLDVSAGVGHILFLDPSRGVVRVRAHRRAAHGNTETTLDGSWRRILGHFGLFRYLTAVVVFVPDRDGPAKTVRPPGDQLLHLPAAGKVLAGAHLSHPAVFAKRRLRITAHQAAFPPDVERGDGLLLDPRFPRHRAVLLAAGIVRSRHIFIVNGFGAQGHAVLCPHDLFSDKVAFISLVEFRVILVGDLLLFC